MIDWQTVPLLGFDVESTGVTPHEDRVVTAALDRHWPARDPLSRTWLINPGIEIPEEAAAVHGITTAHAVEHGEQPWAALVKISDLLVAWMGRGYPVVAFNAAFDFTMLEADLTRHQLSTVDQRLGTLPLGPIIDPSVLDKYVDTYRPGSRTLTATCAEYGVALDNAHAADADARAAVYLTRAIFNRHRDKLGELTLGGIYHAQKHWRKLQMLSLRQYHRREGTAVGDYDYGWPVHTNLGPDPIQAAEQGALL